MTNQEITEINRISLYDQASKLKSLYGKFIHKAFEQYASSYREISDNPKQAIKFTRVSEKFAAIVSDRVQQLI